MEHTFAIIKPDAVQAGHAAAIIALIQDNGFSILGQRKERLSREQAEQFYAIHKERPFFGELVDYMISGPVVLMVLEKDDAVQAWRDLMGATDPAKAAKGTIRKLYGTNIGANATHGSDSAENAHIEIEQFFPELA